MILYVFCWLSIGTVFATLGLHLPALCFLVGCQKPAGFQDDVALSRLLAENRNDDTQHGTMV
jgi:hypothetical protein